jgi:beta-barrel assembly-enhancing protease
VENAQRQNYGVAANALQEQIERNPEDATAYYNHAKVLWEQGGAKNAQQVLDQLATAIDLNPKLPDPWRAAGVVFYELRDVNRAAQAFERYVQLAPNAPDAPKLKAFVAQVKQNAQGLRVAP